MKLSAFDEQWQEFCKLAKEQGKLPSSSVEWREAYQAWRVLDGFQKQKAIEYLVSCEDMQVTHATALNYLRRRIFERPLPRGARKAVPIAPAAPEASKPPLCERCGDYGWIAVGGWTPRGGSATIPEIEKNSVPCGCARGTEWLKCIKA